MPADGTLRGFRNICRHRGAEVTTGEGNCSTFRCPYHKWTYYLKKMSS
jgi:phenylpropionate dioxygenase-like ring-hydroxylating dioxygenase large terminal subunit